MQVLKDKIIDYKKQEVPNKRMGNTIQDVQKREIILKYKSIINWILLRTLNWWLRKQFHHSKLLLLDTVQ